MLNGRLYVMGGVECNKLQVLEMSEENEFTWTVKADMPTAQYDAASAVVDGKLWVMGGSIHDDVTDNVAIYDIEADSWGTGPALPHAPRGAAHATTHDGEVCLLSPRGAWVLRNATWVVVRGAPGTHYPACASILLG